MKPIRAVLSAIITVFIGSIVLAAPLGAAVKSGLDVLVEKKFAPLANKRIGVITNHSAVTVNPRRHIVDLLSSPEAKAAGIKLVSIIVGEHGFSGTAAAGANIPSGKHEASGAVIHSLYGRGEASYRPRDEIYEGLDAIVYDMQDVGVRFYTYTATMAYVMEGAAKKKIPFFVLDRPNPINGVGVEGPLLDANLESLVGYFRMPIRHGMTIGELARMFNAEKKIGANLTVVEMQGWKRSMWFDDTGLEWLNPSPNIRNLTQAIVYPGTCLMEGSQVSVGRGTDTPFQWMGAPWMKSREIVDFLNARNIPGMKFMHRRMTPTESAHKGVECEGIDVQLTDRNALDAVHAGLEIAAAIVKFHPGKFEIRPRLLGSADTGQRILKGEDAVAVNATLKAGVAEFKKLREKYLLYK